MLKLGTEKITALHLGSEKIGKAYLGEQLVFGAEKKPSRLPEGYTEVEYIELDEHCGFDTKFSQADYAYTKIEVDMEFTRPYSTADYIAATPVKYVTVGSTTRSYAMTVYRSSETGIGYLYGLSTRLIVSSDNIGAGNRFLVSANGNYKTPILSVTPSSGEPVSKYATNGSSLTFSTIYIGAAYEAHKSVGCKIFSAKLYDRNSMYRNYVPCIAPNGDIGFYDMNGHGFIKNSWSGTASPGPAV